MPDSNRTGIGSDPSVRPLEPRSNPFGSLPTPHPNWKELPPRAHFGDRSSTPAKRGHALLETCDEQERNPQGQAGVLSWRARVGSCASVPENHETNLPFS